MKHSTACYIASMVIFGTIGPFVRVISVPSGELALYRAVLGAMLIGIYLLSRKHNPFSRGMGKDVLLLLLSGGAMGVNWILLFEAYQYTTVSTATLCYYFAPVIVTVLSPLLFGEQLTWKQILCFCMATLGLVLITLSGNTGGSFTGILFGLGAAGFYAAVILLNKSIRRIDGVARTFLQLLAAIAALVPYVAPTGGVTLSGMNAAGWMCLLIVGIVHTGITYYLYFTSLKAISGQTAAILSYIDPLVAVLVSVALLREPLTIRQALGGALILSFTLLNLLPAKIRHG